jgi:hypothetical protein
VDVFCFTLRRLGIEKGFRFIFFSVISSLNFGNGVEKFYTRNVEKSRNARFLVPPCQWSSPSGRER